MNALENMLKITHNISKGGNSLDNKILLLMAFDALLLELDSSYIPISEDKYQLFRVKLLESYGVRVSSTDEEIKEVTEKLIIDIYKHRDELIKQI